MSENIKFNLSDSIDVSLEKERHYWYQKNETDVPEYVKVIEIHKDGNNYYYTIQMIDKSEKQTICKYLFNLENPPLYSLLPHDNRERCGRMFHYGFIKGQLLQRNLFRELNNNKDDTREWRFEDIIPKNEEDRKRLNCVYNHALTEARVRLVRQFWLDGL
jgi:hypothetical protein